MSFLSRLFGQRAVAANRDAASVLDSGQSQFKNSQVRASKAPQATAHATRKELLRVVLRDTLKKHGIPPQWVTGVALAAMSRDREPGLYWRIVIRHWDARLPNCCVALQNALVSRVQMFDPMAEKWLHGIAWQFALEDEAACPALPHPGSWTAASRKEAAAAKAVVDAARAGDVIAGPMSIDLPPADVKADLERLMSALDAQYHAADHGDRPAYTATEPARL
jgi:hypothetical protein